MEGELPLRQRTFLSAFASKPHEIIPSCLYLGGISATQNTTMMSTLGITHVLSIGPECTWDVPTRMAIHIDDSPDSNILDRLSEACDFIQQAIDSGGRIYVHCVLGISRSVTVVCAYLMKTQGLSAAAAVAHVKSIRDIANPNYGFLEQLEVWQACDYAPSATHPAYASWKRKFDDENAFSINSAYEPIRLADRLYITEDLPSAAQELACYLRKQNITHLLTLSPHQPIVMSESTPVLMGRCHINLEDGLSDDLVLSLPEIVEFIDGGLRESADSVVLLHSFDLTRICIAVSAYWMAVRNLSSATAFRLLKVGLPLYSPTTEYTALMTLFESCDCVPVPTHPEVIAFRERRKEEEGNRKFRFKRGNNADAPWIMWQPSDSKEA